VTKEVLGQIATEPSAVRAWCAILGMFASQSRAWIIHLRSKMSGTRKGESTSCVAYYANMKGFTDKMVAAGERLDDEQVITYILAGLDFEYNPFVEAFTAKTEPQMLNNLFRSSSRQKHVLKLRRNISKSVLMLLFVVAVAVAAVL
jgi:hypothetical protein